MTKGEDFKLLKIQTCVLKVNIHCDGCKHRVKKLLQRIEGVYTVCIDADQQKVTVSGTADSATLIKKLLRSGKHAELCSQKGNQMRKLQPNCNKDEKSAKEQKMDIFKDLKTHQKFPTFSLDDDVEDDDDEEDDEEEFRFLREKAAKVGLIRQVNEANAKKKNVSNGNNAGAGAGGNNGGKKGGNGGNQNQNGILKTSGGVQRTDIAANRDLNIAHNGGGGANGGGGFGFQAQPNDFQSSSGQQGYGIHGYQHPSAMMNNMNMMNMQNMNDRFIQQMMYHNKSPVAPSNITYHPYQSYYYHPYHHPHRHGQSESVEYASHMFSDENTSSCSVM